MKFYLILILFSLINNQEVLNKEEKKESSLNDKEKNNINNNNINGENVKTKISLSKFPKLFIIKAFMNIME